MVDRLPDPADADLLAQISVGGQGEASAEAIRTFQALGLRHTDRPPGLPHPTGGAGHRRHPARGRPRRCQRAPADRRPR